MATKTQRFRQLIEAPEILIQPGIHDGFSARLAQQMGFRSAAISGAGLSDTNLGWADVGLMNYEENLHASRAIADDLMGFGTIKDMERRFLTETQRQAKYGAAAQ